MNYYGSVALDWECGNCWVTMHHPSAKDAAQYLCESKALAKPHNRRTWTARLCYDCEVVPRSPGNTVPMTPEENDLFVKLTWWSWDYLWWTLLTGNKEQLSNIISRPDDFILEKASVVCTDAVPIYLAPSTGRLCVPWALLDERQARRRAKADGIAVEHSSVSLAIDAQGSSRKNKGKLTWVCRWRSW